VKLQYRSSLSLVYAISLCLLITGCASLQPTMPNEPYSGPFPPSFSALAQQDRLLSREIAKLPEIQDGVSGNDTIVLEKLVKLYDSDPGAFEIAFEAMYQTGIPETRKYCSPLQALFWIIDEGNMDVAQDVIRNYSLKKLLTSAWNFQIKPIAFSDEQLSEIIDNMNDKQLQKIYLQKINDKEYLQRRITKNYEYFPKIFNRKARKIIRYAKSNAEDKRWCEFSMVTDRLNAPELVDYYERKKISYAEWTTIPHYLMNYENNVYACAQYVFANNRGDCSYITGFTIYCLRKSGYTAFEIRVRPNLSRYKYHAVCVYSMNGVQYVMDNGRHAPRGIIPYDTFMSYRKRI
jgi:hypothetical protein